MHYYIYTFLKRHKNIYMANLRHNNEIVTMDQIITVQSLYIQLCQFFNKIILHKVQYHGRLKQKN